MTAVDDYYDKWIQDDKNYNLITNPYRLMLKFAEAYANNRLDIQMHNYLQLIEKLETEIKDLNDMGLQDSSKIQELEKENKMLRTEIKQMDEWVKEKSDEVTELLTLVLRVEQLLDSGEVAEAMLMIHQYKQKRQRKENQ